MLYAYNPTRSSDAHWSLQCEHVRIIGLHRWEGVNWRTNTQVVSVCCIRGKYTDYSETVIFIPGWGPSTEQSLGEGVGIGVHISWLASVVSCFTVTFTHSSGVFWLPAEYKRPILMCNIFMLLLIKIESNLCVYIFVLRPNACCSWVLSRAPSKSRAISAKHNSAMLHVRKVGY